MFLLIPFLLSTKLKSYRSLIIACLLILIIVIANAQEGLWNEDFRNLRHHASIDAGPTSWELDMSRASMGRPTSKFSAQHNSFVAHNVRGVAIWRSEEISLNGLGAVNISIDLYSKGLLDEFDYIKVYFIANGERTLFENGEFYGDITKKVNRKGVAYGHEVAFTPNIEANTVQIEVEIKNDHLNEWYLFDNVHLAPVGCFSDLKGSNIEFTKSADEVTISLDGLPQNCLIQWTGPKEFFSDEPSPVVTEPGTYHALISTSDGNCTKHALINVISIDTSWR